LFLISLALLGLAGASALLRQDLILAVFNLT
jgi:hypothetical protein